MATKATKPVGGLTPNRAALERAIAALDPDDAAAAVVEAARSLASAVDADGLNDALWREYRYALAALREACAGGGDDELENVFEAVRAAVRNPKKS